MKQLTADEVQMKGETVFNSSKIVSESLPILHRLRSRIKAYAKLWCIAGAMALLLVLPAIHADEKLLAVATLITGLSVLFFAVVRIIESRSVSAIIEVDRSDLRRKVWLIVNSVIFLATFIIFCICVFSSNPPFNPWMALPISTFLMIVSISPAWEWYFVYRVIRTNRVLLDNFNRYIQLLYTTDEERHTALLAIDALMMLETLRNRKFLSNTTYQVIVRELLKIDII